MNTTKCEKCGRQIRNNNLARHLTACEPTKRKKIRGVDYDPNWGFRAGIRKAWNVGLTKDDPRVQQYLNSRRPHPPAGCCAWTTEQRRASAKRHKCGGYREGAGRSQKYRVLDSYGNPTVLQSSYELKCCEILNSLEIKWVRPSALKYDGKNYFADFYLPEHDVWLDPKNNYKAKQDAEKIRKVIEQNNIKLYVILKEHLTEEYIASLVRSQHQGPKL